MKNIRIKKSYIAIAILLAYQSSFAEPMEMLEDSWYIGGAVGQSGLEPLGDGNWDVSDKSDLSKKVYGGINVSRDFGLEAFWNDFGEAKVSNKSGDEGSVKYRAYGANVVYHVPSYLGSLHPIVKLGVAKVDTKGEGVEVNQKNNFDVFGGVGAEYEFAEGFRIRAEYEYFDKDIDQLSLGLNWRPTLTRQPVELPKPVIPSPVPLPIIAPKPVVKTVIKHVPVVRTVIQHAPAPPPVVRTVIQHAPTPPPIVQRVVVNNPIPQPQATVVHKTLAGGSNFATNSATLTNSGRDALNRMASDLIRDKVVIHNITIIGHTDNVGSKAANVALSQRRATSVANYLSSRGINRAKMTIVGNGENQPVSSNATAQGRAKNRRVNIVVKGSQTIMR